MNTATPVPGFQDLSPVELVMLSLGTGLFLILAVGLIVLLAKDKKPLSLLPFFFVAIVMIGFPVIRSFTIKPDEVTVQVKELQAEIATVQSNPQNPAARAKLAETLERTKALAATKGKTGVVAESVARASLQLDDAKSAVKWADIAVKAKPQSAPAKNILAEAQQREKMMTRPGTP